LEAVIEEFDKVVGLDKLWIIHLNDSAFGLGAKKDRHKNVGQGEIGFQALRKIVHHPKLIEVIKVLETPQQQGFEEEIKKLKMPEKN
jgi:deoxyribonuclease-4